MSGFGRREQGPEEPDAGAQALEELELIIQMVSDLHVIGGEADRLAEKYPEGDPRKRESDRIRREVATLRRYIAEVMI